MVILNKISTFLIREATENDIESILLIENKVEPYIHATKNTILERLRMFPDGFFVAEENGQILGYIESCIWPERDFESFEEIKNFSLLHNSMGKILYIIYVAVDPLFHGRSIGSRLIKKVVSLAKQLGKDRVQLVAKDVLYNFYKKHGFTYVKQLPNYLPFSNSILMELFINS